ncbi:hypothetical protein AVEN_215312-1 [Araneus ventricosus]|uniref:Transposase Tc1-like domain-containing protein n=1 Tax=Araneus ventricosus TaxID=182803 RepID=A0A4Y2MQH9_ARAVE|nr:hypothetical protein AVEN_3972-1 [Araneus ventricosus]GBN28814.1 hypothetical protein AVEN_107838-1 [Araneus ventricosus]GBN28819.1 hypothetical protein AVEN_121485-1 [Araneus ventricosus]GBN28866.1 hypothetical protein AVEN_215312-1 [Araneus ventricosus]
MWSKKHLSRDRRPLKRLVKKNGKKSTLEFWPMFSMGHKDISTRRIKREPKRMELNSCRPTRKPLVSAMNSEKRFQFAKQHEHWTIEICRNVMWSDESRVSLLQNNGAIGLEGNLTK